MGRKRTITKLSQLRAGDMVYYTNSYQTKIITVTRVTKTLIICSNLKFQRSTGSEVPVEPYNLARIMVLTDELRDRYLNNIRKKELIAEIVTTSWQSLSVDTLERILEEISSCTEE